MTEIKAILRIRSGSYEDFYNANLVYALGELTHIISGTNAGMWKVGDGTTPWRGLPFSPRTAATGMLGAVAGSSAVLFGKINADGTFTLNGIEQIIQDIGAKDTAQDAALATHGESIAELKTKVDGMSGAIIYIGNVDEFTDDLKAMDESDRDALLTARAVEIRGQVLDGYTLEDKGGDTGGSNDWQYQSDGTWFDMGPRGDVSIATNSDFGIVKGSPADLGVGVLSDGTMQVNGLVEKLAATDAKDAAQDGRLTDIEAGLSAFESAQDEVNSDTAQALGSLDTRATGAETRLAGVEAKNTQQDTAIVGETERAQTAEGAISAGLSQETTRAQTAEEGLEEYMGNSAAAIYESLADETARAQTAEAQNQAAVESERDLRIDAVAAEAEARDAAVEQEASDRDAAISTAIGQEVTDRNTAIAAEATARNSAITTAVGAEATARGTAISTAVGAEADARDEAIAAEAEARNDAIAAAIADEAEARNDAVSAEATARDEAIAEAKLSIQQWLAAVDTKANLLDPATLSPTVNYLCRVINDTETPGNNGVWQLVAGESEWSYFSDNLDFIDESELAAAMAGEIADRNTAITTAVSAEATARGTAIGNAISQEVTNRNAAITTTVGAEAAARGTAISAAVSQEVADRNTAISGEAAARNTAISGAIATEVTNRNAAISTGISGEVTNRNTAISAAVAQEVTDRNAAVAAEATARGTAISGEVTARNSAISTAISAEVSARNTAIGAETTRALAAEALLGSAEASLNKYNQSTYLVDSDAALAAWANNTAGNDYTRVLVAPGTFTSGIEVNLTTCGTKVVKGLPGSLLSFTSQYGLRYDTLPTTPEYSMDGVNAETHSGVQNYVFHSCTNLTNCFANGNSNGSVSAYGFHSCTNLTNCTGTGNSSGNSSSYAYGFYNCTNLTNCTGTGNSSGTGSSQYAYGFYNCTNLTNCTGTGNGTSTVASTIWAFGFHSCTNLTNCTGIGTSSAISTGYGNAAGFHSCTNLINCAGGGTGSGKSYGYGFQSCKGMVLNKPQSAPSMSSTYASCFVSIAGSGDAPANTAAGGWNR
jgi:hypothetical protein